MIASTIHVLILVPVFFALMKERPLRRGVCRTTVPQRIEIPAPRYFCGSESLHEESNN